MSYLVNRRVHITDTNWSNNFGTDYWFFVNSGSSVTAPSGWTMTALSLTASGLVGDFHSSADIDPYFISFGASGDLMQSPIIFGGYDWQQAQKSILGYAPTKLCVEVHAQYTVHTANEPTSCFGFVKGAASTAANAVATIYTNGTNFFLTDGTTSDQGTIDDGLWHIFKIVVDGTNTEWFIDGVSQGTITTETDEWPVAFGAHSFTTNRLGISYIHVWAE